MGIRNLGPQYNSLRETRKRLTIIVSVSKLSMKKKKINKYIHTRKTIENKKFRIYNEYSLTLCLRALTIKSQKTRD